MATELAAQIRRLGHGDHSCLIYETPAEQRAAIVPFFVEGLARGERCLWIADDRSVEEVKAFLFEAGVDVGAEMARGAFLLRTKRETYLQDGAFDPRAMIETLRSTLAETITEGFTGLRGSGEMTWAVGGEPGSDRIIEYEALLNDFFPGKSFVAICQYNRSRFAPGVILDVLRTHHYAVVGELVCPNLYFEPSEMVLGEPTDSSRLEWRLRQLIRAREGVRTLEEGIRAREEFFAVAGHELRTPLSALQLQLEVALAGLEQRDGDAPEITRVHAALGQTRRLIELAERLLDVTQLHAAGLELTRRRTDLATLVREQLERTRAAADGARCIVNLDHAPAVEGEWDRRRIEQVVGILLSNAFKYGAGRPVRVTVGLQGKLAVLIVEDEGIGIAPADQGRIFGPFQRAVSTDHYSGFGVGLWTARQIVEAHGGTIQVESEPGSGATFRVYLPTQPDVRQPRYEARATAAAG